jgi:hypothetical protein
MPQGLSWGTEPEQRPVCVFMRISWPVWRRERTLAERQAKGAVPGEGGDARRRFCLSRTAGRRARAEFALLHSMLADLAA